MVAVLERVMRAVRSATIGSGEPPIPRQALRDYDVTDEGCERMRKHFADSFAGDDWDDIEGDVRRVGSR